MTVKIKTTSALGALCLGMLAQTAFACTADQMARTEDGFFRKVVAGSDRITAMAEAGGTETVFTLELMKPYYVICEDGDALRVTDLAALSVAEAETGLTGYVRKDQIYEWPTAEGLSFSDLAFLGERPEIAAWDNRDALLKFMETGDDKTNPPTFRENIDATLRREKGARPYPVLASDEGKLLGRAERRYFDVLLPAAIRSTDAVVLKDGAVDAAARALTSATIVIAFDATGSMEGFAKAVAISLADAIDTLPPETIQALRIGFVFYRDAGDPIPLEAVPAVPLAEASAALEKAAVSMSGGGDDAEPVLDAVQYAAQLYDWPADAGKKIVVAVLNDDAKPATTSALDERIPAGIDAIGVARGLFEEGVPVISVQAGPKAGQMLTQVLSSLANETSGEFVPWNEGVDSTAVAGALSTVLQERTTKEIDAGREVVGKIYDFDGAAAIPLEVIDGEKLERLREAGIAFNIAKGEDGILVQPGFMIETPDLMEPNVQISKDTLLELINLMSVLSVTGVDSESLHRSVAQSLAAIAGEEVDPAETIAETLQRQLGVKFKSGLLEFNLEYLDALTPGERASFAKRLQDGAAGLDAFLNARMAEFDSGEAVWMPITALP
ncbi:MAG: hypothetical protein CFE34_05615 [Rhodobacteraceae bacterium PARR1]|nr:MAG: hypothetical protein CFE34_05615 [Rhodobacteraceae bacterium PARR1]